MKNNLKLGEILRQREVLTAQQLELILLRQKMFGAPFGTIAAEMFDIREADIWWAWAVQMADVFPRATLAELEFQPAIRDFVTARQAWAHRILPVSADDAQVLLATSMMYLPGAMAFVQVQSELAVAFCILETPDVERGILEAYGPPLEEAA